MSKKLWMLCLLVLAGCDPMDLPSDITSDLPSEFGKMASPLVNDGYWAGVAKAFPRTPMGHVVGIARHNSYQDLSSDLEATTAKLQLAIDADADIVELDIVERSDGEVRIEHVDTGAKGPRLKDVLDYEPLKSDDSVLYIEVKESSTPQSLARKLLDILNARKTWYAREGRPVVIRGFNDLDLDAVKALLPEYPELRPYIRFHVLFYYNACFSMGGFHDCVEKAKSLGWHGIEFPYTDRNILSKITYAKSLGLSVTLWTIPEQFGEIFLSNLREEVDAFVVDYDVAKARAVVSDANQLLYLNVWNQPHGATTTSVLYYRDGTTAYSVPVNVAGAPSTMWDGPGEDRYGTSLLFSAKSAQSLPFYDVATATGQGYLVSAYINFDDLLNSCPGNASNCTMALLSKKAEGGGFTLELSRSSTGERLLRFGVHVNGSYRYATYSLGDLNETQGYLITGAYDGNGDVRLWVNNNNGNTSSSGPFMGGVQNTTVPMTAGANPLDSSGPRSFLSGKVQMLQVLRWAARP